MSLKPRLEPRIGRTSRPLATGKLSEGSELLVLDALSSSRRAPENGNFLFRELSESTERQIAHPEVANREAVEVEES